MKKNYYNPEKRRAYRKANREKLRAYFVEYKRKNRAKIKEHWRVAYAKNPTKFRELARIAGQASRNRHKAAGTLTPSQIWYRKNREYMQAYHKARQLRLKGEQLAWKAFEKRHSSPKE